MGITTEQYEKIIRFLDAGMDGGEMDDFEKELAANPEMRYQLDFEQSVRDGFTLQNITRLSGAVPVKESMTARVMPGKIIGMRKWLTIGAAVVMAFTLFTVFWQKQPSPDVAGRKDIDTAREVASQPEASVAAPGKDSNKNIDLSLLFKQYFKKDALPEQYPPFLAQAFMDYESGNYTTLQQLNLNDLPQTRGTGETDSKESILKWGHYYKGLAFLQTDNIGEAVINLDWVLNSRPDKALRAKAQWYLTLAYLKDNNGKKAAELCRGIVGNRENHILVKNAKQLLDTLRE